MVAPATGQKEAVPQWYDVDVVRGTQYTVSGYNVKVDVPTDQGQEVSNELPLICTPSNEAAPVLRSWTPF